MRNKNKDIVIRNVVRVSLLLILAALIYRIYSQVTELASDPGSRALQDHNDASKRISSQQASGIIPSGKGSGEDPFEVSRRNRGRAARQHSLIAAGSREESTDKGNSLLDSILGSMRKASPHQKQTADGNLGEDIGPEFLKISSNKHIPTGYRSLNCSEAFDSEEDVFRLIAPYEICALGGGAVSGPREDGSPAVLICPDTNSGYGCRIITRVKVGRSEFEIPRFLDWGARPSVDPSTYQTDAAQGSARESIRQALIKYVSSSKYKARVKRIMKANLTGIIIPAGGSRLVTNLLVTLKVLRDHHMSPLPVEVMWQGPAEMDSSTWTSIKDKFAPIRGVDIQSTPHPVPGLHLEGVSLTRYTGKVYSLLVSEFRHVLMLDADSMPVQPPDTYFRHPQYGASGNLFWPAAWQDQVKDQAYEMHGLKPALVKDILNQGKGYSPRDTESGQLLIDRALHLDVLEYVFWINSFPGDLKGLIWGDKDTFGLAFAAAGKAHLFSQVAVPPAGLFTWRKDILLIKATREKDWGWHLIGVLQHDSWGRPAFIHRTINKYTVEEKPLPLMLITSPMPSRWTSYYLAQANKGPTVGAPYDYAVPASAVTELMPTKTAKWVYESGGELFRDPLTFTDGVIADAENKMKAANKEGSVGSLVSSTSHLCPVPTFISLWTMRANGLPIDLSSHALEACLPVLELILGPAEYLRYREKGWLEMPTLRYLDKEHMSSVPKDWSAVEVTTPIPAWRPDFSDRAFDGPFARSVRAAYLAHDWVLREVKKGAYPLLNSTPS